MTTEAFVRAWMEGRDVKDIATDCNCSERSVSRRASNLRSKGVDLPRRNGPLDIKRLNKVIKEMARAR